MFCRNFRTETYHLLRFNTERVIVIGLDGKKGGQLCYKVGLDSDFVYVDGL